MASATSVQNAPLPDTLSKCVSDVEVPTIEQMDIRLKELKSSGVRVLCIGERNRATHVRCAILDTGQRIYPPHTHNLAWKIEHVFETPILSTVVYQKLKPLLYLNAQYCRLSAYQCWSTGFDTIRTTEDVFTWLVRNRKCYTASAEAQQSLAIPYFNEAKPLL